MGEFIKFLFRVLPWLLLFGLLLVYVERNRQEQPVEAIAQEENPLSLLEEVTQMGRMELVRYRFKDVLRFKKSSGYLLIPDQEVLMVVSGEAMGCIDLLKIDSADIQYIGADTVLVQLPQPEMCYTKLNLDSTQIYDISLSKLFDKTDLVQQAYKEAEQKVTQMAFNSGILEQTRQNAVWVLQPLLEKLSNQKTVLLRFRPTEVPIQQEGN